MTGQPGGYEIPGHFSSGPQQARGIASGSGPGPCTDVGGRSAGHWRSKLGTSQIKLLRPVSRRTSAKVGTLSPGSRISKPAGSGVGFEVQKRALRRQDGPRPINRIYTHFRASESSRMARDSQCPNRSVPRQHSSWARRGAVSEQLMSHEYGWRGSLWPESRYLGA